MDKKLEKKMLVSGLMLAGIALFLIAVQIVPNNNESIVKNAAVLNAAAVSNQQFPPNMSLQGKANLQEAVDRLGDKLPEVAAWYGMTPRQLRNHMLSDHTLWIDEQGRLFYREESIVTSKDVLAADVPAESTVAGVSYPLSDTFLLHSNPGSKRVIYLNFKGATLSGVAWNSYNSGNDIIAPAWDIDGDMDSFGDSERQLIQNVWRRVAEDFAPFDVDVTTEEPPLDRIARTSSDDEYYGTVALVSPISGYFGNYGGLAYVGVFDSTNNTY